ncbi:MAG: hypothetical protein HRT70_10770 [Flavobacteriaceae bacterium]|nr:hypothetical protein [Flavobacteriaceae bacterium]
MYIIRNKTSLEVLAYHCVAYDPQITATDFYTSFDPKIMEMAWTHGETERFPPYFSIDKDHKAVALTLEQAEVQGHLQLQPEEKIVGDAIVPKSNQELVAEGLLKLQPQEKLVDDRIVQKSNHELVTEGLLILNDPFEYVDQKDEIQRYTVADLMEKDLIKTQAAANACLKELDDIVERAIQPEYSVGYESKLTKRYLEWMGEGKPANDGREEKFLTMQQRIDEIRLEYKDLREQVKTLQETLKE